jgi:hypothetical protein
MPRPKFKPTEEQRRLVKTLAGLGIQQEQIGRRLSIRSTKTLRKHFRQELDQGAFDATAHVSRTLYQMATSGTQLAATLFWLKCRAGWQERPSFDRTPHSPPPFIVAKEEGLS